MLHVFPGNYGLFEDMIVTFKRVTTTKIAAIKTAVAARNFQELSHLAHSLKPMSDYLGIPLMRTLVKHLEDVIPTKDISKIKKQICLLERLVEGINSEIDAYLTDNR